eukprot:CAMPEP_0172770698 /NCGR_PEP_ID=MMETSP1074-20121228/189173_1 /TAXON_ID=2916 /ORGANISM="Ceratium fusus, Strain PA161109" /LENGTH=400 /DNA_ID=CAMNT_0013606507 /DNA_START=322 /DNA_END=1520 /DNA_ORIENTATION=-
MPTTNQQTCWGGDSPHWCWGAQVHDDCHISAPWTLKAAEHHVEACSLSARTASYKVAGPIVADGELAEREAANTICSHETSVSEQDRVFLAKVNQLAGEFGTSAFGDSGMPNPSKAARVLSFVKKAAAIWPELGKWSTVCPKGFEEIDPECPFWLNGRAKFLIATKAHFNSINSKKIQEVNRRNFLSNMGFVLIEEFITPREEAKLLDYWRTNGPIFRHGASEQHTNRRFFHYGPILPRQSFGTTRSTLGVVPARMGTMPPVVEDMQLRERLRKAATGLGDEMQLTFDQLYVNFYSAAAKGRIGFHHDHVGTMQGVIAGLSLSSSCELHLLALDTELSAWPPLALQLPPRSLYLMSGLSRYHLQHGIPVHRADRLSLTFRTVDRGSAAGSNRLWAREWSS